MQSFILMLYAIPLFFMITVGAFNLNGITLKSKNTDIEMPGATAVMIAFIPILNLLVTGAILGWIIDKIFE